MGKADRVKQRTKISRKRKFHGNQHSSTTMSLTENASPNTSRSSMKMQAIETNTPKKSDKKITGYRIMDMENIERYY